jgi:hypothetical protein
MSPHKTGIFPAARPATAFDPLTTLDDLLSTVSLARPMAMQNGGYLYPRASGLHHARCPALAGATEALRGSQRARPLRPLDQPEHPVGVPERGAVDVAVVHAGTGLARGADDLLGAVDKPVRGELDKVAPASSSSAVVTPSVT